MALQIRDPGGVLRTSGAAYIRDASAVLRTIDQIRVREDGGVLKQVYQQGIRLAASPDSAYGYSSAKTGPIYTNSVTVNVAGGTPPYTHSWTATGGISPAAPTSSTTPFIGVPGAISGELEGDGTDFVTDANGLTNSISVPISITRGF